MDREFLQDLLAPFGAVTIRRMFSGFGISVDGVNFALALRETLYLRVDERNRAAFEAEGSQPFVYSTKAKTVTVASYWRLPDRLLDDSDELAEWARAALAAAQRAALTKRAKSPAKSLVKSHGKAGSTKKTAVSKTSAAVSRKPAVTSKAKPSKPTRPTGAGRAAVRRPSSG